jgi:hypothetical protein
MIAVIKGDIINSRASKDPEKWLKPLKALLEKWGETPRNWELMWGDFFQLEVDRPLEALKIALEIKALIKSIQVEENANIGSMDVRMSIGIGKKDYSGSRVSESNGPAFVYSGEKFEKLKKEKITLAVQSPWEDFNEEMNLYLKLASALMDRWSVPSGELVKILLENPDATQDEIGALLGIKQNSVSGRWSRANVDEILAVERIFRKKLAKLIG